jgi:DNA-binding winged helix-turn-helix (wHTH) protein
MRFTFENCLFDSDTREVFREGSAVSLSPKAFLLLELLIRNRPTAVSKQDVHKHLWPETFVSEANLGNLVVELRAALGDDARKTRIIRTLPRFGYAFRAKTKTAREKETKPSAAYRLIWGNREIDLEAGENLLGRDRNAVVWIDDESVSRRHARLVIDDSGATLEDLGSKNGTYLRGKKIRTATRLGDKDVIRIGPATIVIRFFRRTGTTVSTIAEKARR